MKKLYALLAALALFATSGLAMAQDTVGHKPAMSPKHRLVRQHRRIHRGVKKGTLSKSEHRKLSKEARAINRQRKADLKKDGGKLTPADRRKLEAEENLRSKQILKDKHN